jgi:hypothetical protein
MVATIISSILILLRGVLLIVLLLITMAMAMTMTMMMGLGRGRRWDVLGSVLRWRQ